MPSMDDLGSVGSDSQSLNTDSSSGGDPLDAMFRPMPSIQKRYPGLEGKVLLDKIVRTYGVHNDITLPFFDKHEHRALFRHPRNQRLQTLVETNYKNSILDKGIMQGVRGTAWCTYSKGRTLPYLMVTYGTLSSAFYRAHTEQPYNANVVSTLNSGIAHAIVFHEDTPDDVLDFLKEEHNSYHTGAHTSFLETL
eukprot:11452528-Alexandrium_andersonii.AAC.1